MPLIITDTPTRPFEKCALDIVGPLIVITNGNKYMSQGNDENRDLIKFLRYMINSRKMLK